VCVFYAGEDVLDIGCKSKILRKEPIGIGLKLVVVALSVL
jgi:hypothetical protein